MKHVYLMNPFLWDGFKSIEFEDRKVAWLLIIPISNEEKDYAVANGASALEMKL
ncbi:suppressor of fused domain protein [Clostridium estertheticum]|uniref:suppressor of fused domain protein n=1 Tax=Clostridium estertheticum TaxID=238834 RepID=UPI001F2C873C|nr:suppressor of fused domain protein [Clostridium estertheticum]